jgi:NAD(P)-dependent dehydrogenase (short-subunit alcohol dehydrogenase family)
MSAGPRLADRIALITGGSRGIGFGIARAFVDEGAHVLLVGTNAETLRDARANLVGRGPRVETAVTDVADRAACFELVRTAHALFGRVDILVNCAAIYIPKRFLDYTAEEFDAVQRVNLHGPFHLIQAALPGMLERKWGRVINIASTAGKWGSRNQAAYNVAKHGLVGMTRCVALETAGSGVTVNAICPGLVQTDLLDQFWTQHAAILQTTPDAVRAELLKRQPIGRFLDPAEVGSLAVYLAAEESAGMTGQSLLLDGGMLFV